MPSLLHHHNGEVRRKAEVTVYAPGPTTGTWTVTGGNPTGTPACIYEPAHVCATELADQPLALDATVAKPGDKMDLVDAPNATALGVIVTAVWAATTRTLSSFGTLASDTAAAVWDTLTSAARAGGSFGAKF